MHNDGYDDDGFDGEGDGATGGRGDDVDDRGTPSDGRGDERRPLIDKGSGARRKIGSFVDEVKKSGKSKVKITRSDLESPLDNPTDEEIQRRLNALKDYEGSEFDVISSGGYRDSIGITYKGREYYFGGKATEKARLEFEKKYPNMNKQKITEGKITFGMDSFNNPYVKILSGRDTNVPYHIDYETATNSKGKNLEYPKTIKKILGKRVQQISMENFEKQKENKKELKRIGKETTKIHERLQTTEDPEERARLKNEFRENKKRYEELERENEDLAVQNEAVEERLSLRERVKLVFEKYGLTALGIITAVGTVIGVVVSNLKSGLAKVAIGVGDGLKELGKKLAQLLPGMIGAIAKYVFNAAGEAIGYLAKNTWLLIVAAVVYAVEQFKKKNK